MSVFDKYDRFRRDDPIARLYVHYFFQCDYLRRDYQRVTRALAKQKRRTKWRASQQICYLRLWLATLYAVIEGYQNLQLKDEYIDELLATEHVKNLRLFRNGTFHFQTSGAKHTQFFDTDGARDVWAQMLHSAFDEYFKQYRRKVVVENFLAAHSEEA